jgi:non-canonical (house-cleaning) NTP pyrophosphatase
MIDKLVACAMESSGQDLQPMSMEETIVGAVDRAKNAYNQSSCDLAI